MPHNVNQDERLKRILAVAKDKKGHELARYLYQLEQKLENMPEGSALETANKIAENILKDVKGEKGDTYELTDDDRQTIAKYALALIDYAAIAQKVHVPQNDIANLVYSKMRQPKDGRTPTDAEILKLIKRNVAQPDEDKIAQMAANLAAKEVQQMLPEEMLITDIRNGLEKLTDNERLDISAIKGMDQKLEELRRSILQSIPSRGGAGNPIGDRILVDDLSAQTDGSTYVFELEKRPMKKWFILHSSDFPNILRKDTDFTVSNKTLTLNNSELPEPPSDGSTLIAQYAI